MIYEFTNGQEKRRISATNYTAAIAQLAQQEKCDPNQPLFHWHLVREEEEIKYYPLTEEEQDETPSKDKKEEE